LKAAFCPLSEKNGSLFWLHCLIRNFWKFAKNGRKKSSKSFSDLLLIAAAARRRDIQFLWWFGMANEKFIIPIFYYLFRFSVFIETPYTYKYGKANDTIIYFCHTSRINSFYQVWNATQ